LPDALDLDIRTAPVVADGTVYVGTTGRASAFDAANGEQHWRVQVGSARFPNPAVGNGLVYLAGRDDALHALDASTGAERWSVHGGVADSITLAGEIAYTAGADGIVHAFDAATGDERWQFSLGTPSQAQITVAGGVLYVGTGWTPAGAKTNVLVALGDGGAGIPGAGSTPLGS
jgi:outer membrane protein assembly factor BamB